MNNLFVTAVKMKVKLRLPDLPSGRNRTLVQARNDAPGELEKRPQLTLFFAPEP